MQHQRHIERFKDLLEAEGYQLSEEEVIEQFHKLYAFMRLVLRHEYDKQNMPSEEIPFE